MNRLIQITLAFLLLIGAQAGFAQGFVNLNFENATIVTDPSQGPPLVFAANAIPGWTAYINGFTQTDIPYNSQSTGLAVVNLEGTNNSVGIPPIQGKYFIYLQPDSSGHPSEYSALGQTGQVSVSALSFVFWGSVGMNDVSFNGQTLSLTVLGSTPNYNIYGADISAFAGQTGQLLFTAAPQTIDIIDNIQFSNLAVPEPTTLALTALGGAFLCLRRRIK